MKGSSFFATSPDSLSESGYSVKLLVSPGLAMEGMKGAGIFLVDSLYQSTVLNHLCYLMSLAPFLRHPYLLVTSAQSRCFTNDLASLSKSLGNLILPFRIF